MRFVRYAFLPGWKSNVTTPPTTMTADIYDTEDINNINDDLRQLDFFKTMWPITKFYSTVIVTFNY